MARWINRFNKLQTTAGKSRRERGAPSLKWGNGTFPIFPRRMSRLFTIDRVYNQMKVITILSRFYSGAY